MNAGITIAVMGGVVAAANGVVGIAAVWLLVAAMVAGGIVVAIVGAATRR